MEDSRSTLLVFIILCGKHQKVLFCTETESLFPLFAKYFEAYHLEKANSNIAELNTRTESIFKSKIFTFGPQKPTSDFSENIQDTKRLTLNFVLHL